MDAPVSEAFEAYYELLTHWNTRINLTALPLENPVEATIDRLFIEPLAAADAVLEGARLWVDLGSGGGSPAIPMKVLYAGVGLTLVESKSRKAAFLREAVRELELSETAVAETRFEQLADDFNLREVSDVVTVRAVRPDQTVFGTAASVLKSGGRLAIFTSSGSVQLAASGDFSIGE
ncbi:MAG TPA: 16S rRNA (guanine(527)-N(7))-methyltransferase RsmG, partial [Vicinamibacterales bacterium]|nr:16S rRNA (guanine(527)-N(7))-methyltransferase RsmG [Vicinamibacterales bacterium]